MSSNKTNLLRKILEIQRIVLDHKKKGTYQKWVYDNLIRDRYFISYATFNRYLTINAKKELKELGQEIH